MAEKDYLYEFERSKLLANISDEMITFLEDSNAILAGGAITSIFTGKEINDLDVYFRTWEDLGAFLYCMQGTGYRILSYTDKAVLIYYNQNDIEQGHGKAAQSKQDNQPGFPVSKHFQPFS